MEYPNIVGQNPDGLEPEETFETLKGQIYSPRWGSTDSYDLTRTDKGWITGRRGPIDNQACPDGSPAWYGELSNDGILWVSGTPFFIEQLWEGLEKGDLTQEEAQEAFARYCAYLTEVNRLEYGPFDNPPQTWDEDTWERLEQEYPGPD